MERSGGRSALSLMDLWLFSSSRNALTYPELFCVPGRAAWHWHWHWDDGWEFLQRRARSWSFWRLSKPGFAVGQVFHLFCCFSCLGAVCCVYFGGEGQHSQLMLGECSGGEASLESALLSAAHGKALRFPFSGRHRRYFGLQAVALKKPTQQ